MNNPRRGDDFFSPNIYQTQIKDDSTFEFFSGNFYLEHVTSQMAVFHSGCPLHVALWKGRPPVAGRSRRSFRGMCGPLRSKGRVFFFLSFFFQLKMDTL